MESNKLFKSLIKITNSKSEFSSNEILRESMSMNFIQIKTVSRKNLPKLVQDLRVLLEKLDDALVNLYRDGGPDLQRDYEELIRQLRLKQARFDYLSSFFENTKQKIEAAKKMIEEQDKKISDSENRKRKIEQNIKNVRSKLCRPLAIAAPNPFKLIANRVRKSSTWTHRTKFSKRLTDAQLANNGNVLLQLEPVTSIHQESQQEDVLDEEDWTEEDYEDDEIDID